MKKFIRHISCGVLMLSSTALLAAEPAACQNVRMGVVATRGWSSWTRPHRVGGDCT
jgi:hypothetical protein